MKGEKELSIYQNLDGDYFYDAGKQKFTMNFDDDQMMLLEYGLKHNMPVQALAYPSVSAWCMHDIMEFMMENQGEFVYHNIRRIDYWKVAMIFQNPADCRNALTAMEYDVNIFNEFTNVRILEPQTIELIAIAAANGQNVCGQVKRGLKGAELKEYIENMAEKNAKKRRRRDFLYTLRYPDAKDTGLYG
jgi:hypothetical protein